LRKLFFASFILIFCSCTSSLKKSKREILEQKASYYYNKGIYPEAINYFSELIRIDSTNGEYYIKRGYCNSKSSYLIRALSDYQKAIDLKYDVSSAYLNIAIIAILLEKDSIALIYLDKSLHADSTKYQKIQYLVKMCKLNIEMRKSERWKDFEEYKKRTKQNR
jgi:tetratricopeptide (TPR) repeat protein